MSLKCRLYAGDSSAGNLAHVHIVTVVFVFIRHDSSGYGLSSVDGSRDGLALLVGKDCDLGDLLVLHHLVKLAHIFGLLRIGRNVSGGLLGSGLIVAIQQVAMYLSPCHR